MSGAISYSDIASFVENNISIFHDKQLEDLRKLSLVKILGGKNPYLFKVKHLNVAGDLVKYVLDAFLVSREETNFGEFLERLAIFINNKVYGGWKSTSIGMDLEFDKDGIHYIVSVKSGPKWGNSDQLTKMYINFDNLITNLTALNPNIPVVLVNGCCYGKDQKPAKLAKLRLEQSIKEFRYFKYCGQRFWQFVSGNPNLYIDIVEPLGHRAREKNEVFAVEYANIINKFTMQFSNDFCDTVGAIKWEELVKLSSIAIDAPSQTDRNISLSG